MKLRHIAFLSLALSTFTALAQTAPAPTVRLRATIERVEAGAITVRERSGEVITLAMPDNAVVNEVVPISLNDIRPGSFIGTGALPRADGTLEAVEVLVFPESARGTGEGHRAWDLLPNSTMTNATVADFVSAPEGRRMVLKYKDGEKTVIVPEKAPIVTFQPGDRSLIVVGAKVIITAAERNGQPTVLRIQAGRNGFTPPM